MSPEPVKRHHHRCVTREDGMGLFFADVGKIEQQGGSFVKERTEWSSNEWSQDDRSSSKKLQIMVVLRSRLWTAFDAIQFLAMVGKLERLAQQR